MKKITLILISIFISLQANYISIKENPEKLKTIEFKCDLGDTKSCKKIINIYKKYNKFNLVNKYAAIDCKLNSKESCYLLGKNILEGKGALYNRNKGLKIIEIACNKNSKKACFDLIKYKKNNNQFIEKACILGEQKACDLYKRNHE